MTESELAKRFTAHRVDAEQKMLLEAVRHVGHDLATCINDLCPENREKSLAVTKLEEAVFWANASISRGGDDG